MRVRAAVLDTNVVVAGILTSQPTSPTARIVDGMLAARFPFLLSMELLSEYREVLLRPAIQRLHGLGPDQVDRILTEIVANAAIREPGSAAAAPEPGDQHLWNLLACKPGAVLVTGDQLLLRDPPAAASVISPAAFIRLLEHS